MSELDEEHEEHENHERYLITYADMITLLLALFIILFALGQVDLAKFERFRAGATKAFGVAGLEGGTGVLEAGNAAFGGLHPQIELAADGGPGTSVSPDSAPTLSAALQKSLDAAGISYDQATVGVSERGVIVILSTDEVTFTSGSWQIEPKGEAVLRSIAPALASITNPILIEGHTDDRPMTGGLTNWELSTNRAAAVLHQLEQGGVAGHRLSIAGYGETRPVADNATAAGRAANRRVEIIVSVEDLRPHLEPLAPSAASRSITAKVAGFGGVG